MLDRHKIDLKTLRKKLEVRVNPEYGAYLMREIPKGESLLAQTKKDSKGEGAILGPLTLMYMEMNNQLGLTCKAMNYSLNQREWPDTEPLFVLEQIYPGLIFTKWYQRHTIAALQPINHPWVKLTSISERKSPSSSNEESARDLISQH